MNRVELSKAEKRDVTVLDESTIALLFAAAEKTRLYPFLVLAAAIGARRGELLALQGSDLDFETRMVRITKSLEETLAGLRIKGTKKEQAAPLLSTRVCCRYSADHKDVQARDRELYGATYDDRNLVLCKPDGSFYRPG